MPLKSISSEKVKETCRYRQTLTSSCGKSPHACHGTLHRNCPLHLHARVDLSWTEHVMEGFWPLPKEEDQYLGKSAFKEEWFTLTVFSLINLFLVLNADQCPKLRCNQWLLPAMFTWNIFSSENTKYISIIISSSQLSRRYFSTSSK